MCNKLIFCLTIIGLFLCVHAVHGGSVRRTISLNPVPGCTTGTFPNDSLLVSRLIQAYQVSDNELNRGSAVWKFIFDEKHKDIHSVFANGNFKVATQILQNPAGTNLFFGIDNLCNCFLPDYKDHKVTLNMANICLDGLVRFAEAIGIVRLDNPEWTNGTDITYDADTIIRLIEQKLNLDLWFPNPFPYEYGALSSKGVISYRVPQALYQAWKIKQLVKNIENPRVLEIGGGLGRTAYYASLMGIEDYTIMDIPLTAVCSGYFLGRSLGENKVVFQGEDFTNSTNKIKIISPTTFLNDTKSYDLIINVDSMTEIDPTMASIYLNKIEASTKTFLSINHEINAFTVLDLITQRNSVRDFTRHPYWMREGYVEELVYFK